MSGPSKGDATQSARQVDVAAALDAIKDVKGEVTKTLKEAQALHETYKAMTIPEAREPTLRTLSLSAAIVWSIGRLNTQMRAGVVWGAITTAYRLGVLDGKGQALGEVRKRAEKARFRSERAGHGSDHPQ